MQELYQTYDEKRGKVSKISIYINKEDTIQIIIRMSLLIQIPTLIQALATTLALVLLILLLLKI